MEIRTFHCVGHFCEADTRSTLRGVSGLAKTSITTIFYLTSRPLNIKIFSTKKKEILRDELRNK